MKIALKLIFLCVLVGLLMSCVSIRNHFLGNMLSKWEERDNKILSEQVLPENIVEIANIPYINDGQNGHLLDIYYPENMERPFPVIIDIHGGGFLYGDKKLNKLYNYHLAKNGFIIFNLNYRLAFNETKIPGQIHDIINALNWIEENMELYPADKQKIYLMGESAGAYLATMAVIISGSEELKNIFNTPNLNLQINAIAIIGGLMELEHSSIGYWGMRSMVLENGYEKQKYYQKLILKNLKEIINLPPVFLTTNGDDELEFMTLYFEKILKKNSMEYLYYHISKNKEKRLGHMFNVFYPNWEESIKLNNMMLEYLRKY
jgi:acetyl esterase/lipase